ncbi:cytochrome P450 [Lentinula aciculospora]|uniref:Cytochrome P450 n=1 Tax=Lentinula aciculospora TaxID=153920 RepID=A0A9W9A463_9AGAR|nr:cytochrome P450 [Lentinula aciculospora]
MDTALGIVFLALRYGAEAAGLFVLVQVLRGLWWLFHLLLIAPPFDPLRHLPGPDASRLSNHFSEVMDPARTPSVHEEWVKQFGKTFRYHGFGAHDYRLMSFDLRAISHVLTSPTFEKPWQTRRLLSRVLGQGVFAMEGEAHRIQRRIMAPAFTTQALKNLTPIMLLKAEELRDKWLSMITDGMSDEWEHTISFPTASEIVQENRDAEKNIQEDAVADVLRWISRATLDVIGLAGFDYPFESLKTETEDVYLAYRNIFDSMDTFGGFKRIAELFFPIIEKIFPDAGIRRVNASLKTIRRRGEEIVRSKKQAIMAEITTSKDIWDKDILSLLKKLSFLIWEINTQGKFISTFLFAGSDTTAVALAWALHYLSLNLDAQSRLRVELATSQANLVVGTDYIDALDNLPYLDAVVRETLRFAPPVHGTIRVAVKDDVIPLSEPILLRSNKVVTGVHIRKGSFVHVPIEGMNYIKDVWGDDALSFKPERWLSPPPTALQYPGLANVMSFTFGPHACIGWRFALLEMKVFLATLIPQLEFTPAAEIGKYNTIVTRPFVKGKLEHGPALPLRMSKFTL